MPPGDHKHINIHGRRWGRGLRPYLIIVKLVCVSGFLGGLTALLALVFLGPPPEDARHWQEMALWIHRAYVRLILPSLWGAMFTGILLLIPIWKYIVRMRWFVLKLVIIASFALPMHLLMRACTLILQGEVAEPIDLTKAARTLDMLYIGTGMTLLFGLVLLVLGRIKPRLGQVYGRASQSR